MILSKEVEMLRNELNQLKVLNEHLMNPVRQLTFCKIIIILSVKCLEELGAGRGRGHAAAVHKRARLLHHLGQGAEQNGTLQTAQEEELHSLDRAR